MKKLLLSLCVVGLVGCSHGGSPDDVLKHQKEESTQILDKNSVNLSNLTDLEDSGPTLQFDWEYDIAEKYGTQGFKAIKYCYDRHLSQLDNVDTSSDYGAIKQGEIMSLIEDCSTNSLVYVQAIPEDRRVIIPRDEPANYGLELAPEEVDSFDVVLPIGAENMDTNSSRYKELHKTCTENNSYYADDPVALADAVEFCISKSM